MCTGGPRSDGKSPTGSRGKPGAKALPAHLPKSSQGRGLMEVSPASPLGPEGEGAPGMESPKSPLGAGSG